MNDEPEERRAARAAYDLMAGRGRVMCYLLFAGSNYHPSGGAADFVKAFATLEEAKAYFEASPRGADWARIACLDGDTLVEVCSCGRFTRSEWSEWSHA